MGGFKTLDAPQVVGRVSHIALHPVKSARMIEVEKAVVTPQGVEGDRQFMVVLRERDRDGVHHFLTQRRHKEEDQKRAAGLPTLALIQPDLRGRAMRLAWEGSDAIDVPMGINSGVELKVGIWGNVVRAVEQGERYALWLSEHLGVDVLLVKAAGPFQRAVSQKWLPNDNTLRFQDGYPIHWFLQESVTELSQRAGVDISWRRFRPNFVVEGGNPQAEHLIYQGALNGIPFLQVKPCDRCPTTTVDQDLGKITGTEPLRTLGTYKNWRNMEGAKKVIFGENLLPLARGEVKVGDEMVMTSIRDPPLVYGAKV